MSNNANFPSPVGSLSGSSGVFLCATSRGISYAQCMRITYYIHKEPPPHTRHNIRFATDMYVGENLCACTTCPIHTLDTAIRSCKPLGRTSHISRPQRPHLHVVCIYVPLTDFFTFLSQKASSLHTPWPNVARFCCFWGRVGGFASGFLPDVFGLANSFLVLGAVQATTL
jgi:hypothetical protein